MPPILPVIMPVPVVITAFLDAVNAADTDALLALFHDRGEVNDWGSRYIGHEQIRAWSDRELIGANATLRMLSSEQHGNEVGVRVQVGGDGFNGPSRFVFTMDGAKATEMRITAD
jgi:SnoaL-like domain